MYIVFTDCTELPYSIVRPIFCIGRCSIWYFIGKDDTYNCDDTPYSTIWNTIFFRPDITLVFSLTSLVGIYFVISNGVAEGFMLDFASVIKLSFTRFASNPQWDHHNSIMFITVVFVISQIICYIGINFQLLPFFVLMFFDIGIFILVFLHVVYLLLCTCQKWRNKDVQSINHYGQSSLPWKHRKTIEAYKLNICPGLYCIRCVPVNIWLQITRQTCKETTVHIVSFFYILWPTLKSRQHS